MNTFDYGDEVYFKDREGNLIIGKVIRFNQKSVTIKENTKMEWRVSPSLFYKKPSGVLNMQSH